MQSLDYNPILLFKKQCDKQSDGMDNFADNDFLLCIQTRFQPDMLLKFGNNTICMAATHGTNMYDFHLITVITVDEY